jgi:hypothetical protein
MSIDESAAAPVVDETIDTTLSEDQLDDCRRRRTQPAAVSAGAGKAVTSPAATSFRRRLASF